MNENFPRPTREAERKPQQSCSRVAPTFLKGGRKCPPSFPSCCLWQSQLFSLLQLMILKTAFFSPLLPAKLLCTFPPACQPPQGHQVNCKHGRCKAGFIISAFPLTSCQAVPPRMSAKSLSLISQSYNSRVTLTSPGCLSTGVPSLLFHCDCPRSHLLSLFPGSVFWLTVPCLKSSL